MIPKHTEETMHVGRTSRYSSIGRALFYCWKAALEKHGEAALVRKGRSSRAHWRVTFDLQLAQGVFQESSGTCFRQFRPSNQIWMRVSDGWETLVQAIDQMVLDLAS